MWVLERLVQFFLLVRRASACRHRHAYRERRKLNGVFVMHFVCERCGQGTPAACPGRVHGIAPTKEIRGRGVGALTATTRRSRHDEARPNATPPPR